MISCFSKENNHILMWSHYADKHSGFSLGFKVIKPNKFYLLNIDDPYDNYIPYNNQKYLPLRKVKYLSNKPKPFNPLKESDDIFLYNTLQKAKVWQYENEYRIVISPKYYKDNFVNYNKRILTDIYFGYNTKVEIINEIKEIVKYVYQPINTIKFHYPDNKYMEYKIRYKNFI